MTGPLAACQCYACHRLASQEDMLCDYCRREPRCIAVPPRAERPARQAGGDAACPRT